MEFDEFYRSEFSRMVAVAVSVVGRRDTAEDIVQDAMVDAHRRWDRIGGYDRPRVWLRRVVIQRAMKVARKRRNERNAHLRSLAERPTDDAAHRPSDDLLAAVADLPPQQRAAIALHYLDDASVADIAATIGISTGTVKTHLSRGRAALARRLDEGDHHV